MLLHERDGLLGRLLQVVPDLGRVQDPCAVHASETTGLHPGVRKAVKSVPTEKEESTYSWNLAPLILRGNPKSAKCRWRQFPHGCE
jgi:hypothetical protein